MPLSNAMFENAKNRIQLPEIEEVPERDGERAAGGVAGILKKLRDVFDNTYLIKFKILLNIMFQ
jgi:hypothetical protein